MPGSPNAHPAKSTPDLRAVGAPEGCWETGKYWAEGWCLHALHLGLQRDPSPGMCVSASTAPMSLRGSMHTSMPMHTLHVPAPSPLTPQHVPRKSTQHLVHPHPAGRPRCGVPPSPPLSLPCPCWPHPATAPRQPASPPAQTHSCTPGQAAASPRPRQLGSAPRHRRRHTGEVVPGTCAQACDGEGAVGVMVKCGVFIALSWVGVAALVRGEGGKLPACSQGDLLLLPAGCSKCAGPSPGALQS